MKTCYIVCALDCTLDFNISDEDIVIAADKGYEQLKKSGYRPNVVIGDFDSYVGKINCENIIKYPVKKDDTDSALAVEYAINHGYKNIVIYGAIGGTLDHTIANISLLSRYSIKGINIVLIDENNVLFAISDRNITFDEKAVGRISVFSATERSLGVVEKGLLYELDEVEMKSNISVGVSNEFIGRKSVISVKKGTLLIYTSKENYNNHLTTK